MVQGRRGKGASTPQSRQADISEPVWHTIGTKRYWSLATRFFRLDGTTYEIIETTNNGGTWSHRIKNTATGEKREVTDNQVARWFATKNNETK